MTKNNYDRATFNNSIAIPATCNYATSSPNSFPFLITYQTVTCRSRKTARWWWRWRWWRWSNTERLFIMTVRCTLAPSLISRHWICENERTNARSGSSLPHSPTPSVSQSVSQSVLPSLDPFHYKRGREIAALARTRTHPPNVNWGNYFCRRARTWRALFISYRGKQYWQLQHDFTVAVLIIAV